MFNLALHTQTDLKDQITGNYRTNEAQCIENLLSELKWDHNNDQQIQNLANDLITKVRSNRIKGKGVDALMQEFKLSTQEGVALMCLAESLLRIPDSYTQNQLIQDKIKTGDLASHTKSPSFFVNASSWGLLLTGKLFAVDDETKLSTSLIRSLAKWGEPLIRRAMGYAVRYLGNQFVMAENIETALGLAIKAEQKGYQFSYDMLGEAALTTEDAKQYMASYIAAIHAVGKANDGRGVRNGPGISVKLSAIHPRYTRAQRELVMHDLYLRLKELYLLAKHYQIALFIDAEESDRLEISLDLLEKLMLDPELNGFSGIGFVIQAYQRRASWVVDYVIDLAKRAQTKLLVRLVKGAYWDSEIKRAQVDGQTDYPVYTRKFYTDLSYLSCAKKLLEANGQIYSAFATHNAYTMAAIYTLAAGREYEFQCLYGMGETLYDQVVGAANLNVTCRVYAPVGSYETLLAYLVRRLLENGANSSFVHQLVDPNIEIDSLLINPVDLAKRTNGAANPNIVKPAAIYPNNRINSQGLDLSDEFQLTILESELNKYFAHFYMAQPLLGEYVIDEREAKEVFNPARQLDLVGVVRKARLDEVEIALSNAQNAFIAWASLEPKLRAAKIIQFAALMEANQYELIHLLVREAGKTIANALAEIREAVDFCRYYANQVISEFSNNTHTALGPVVCISPWNFPLAIFVGEIVSALVVGNTVIAKPSDQTNLIAHYAVGLMHQAEIPNDVIQLVLGSGSILGHALTKDERVKAVIFTGSTEVAQVINQNLATKADLGVLIAETGGQNTLIVDSSALPEQVVQDVISSGFDSAGQRCSALRVLYVQADIADKIIHMLKGAMDELVIGNPWSLATDVGPVIDLKAQQNLMAHITQMQKTARMFYQVKLPTECEYGFFVAPTIIEIGSINELKHEVFGPIVHIIRFAAGELENVIAKINTTGFGLTQGLHSRIEESAKQVYQQVKAGNIYINRNMVGAVVGVQPFGGEGLSGTGPKAGGPFYLYRLVQTLNTANYRATVQPVDLNELNTFVNDLAQLALSHEQINTLVQLAQKLKQSTPLAQQIELAGPTGERNFMLFAARGFIACVANDLYEYCVQIIYALATGNQVILNYSALSEQLSRYLPRRSYLTQDLTQVELVHAVLISKTYLACKELKIALAKRNGLLTNLIKQRVDDSYCLHSLVTERAVSINTTATGGNVHLMSMVDTL